VALVSVVVEEYDQTLREVAAAFQPAVPVTTSVTELNSIKQSASFKVKD
jgi:hypothetical protein